MVIPGIQEEQEVFGPEQAPEKDQFILEPKKEEPEYVFEPLNDTQIKFYNFFTRSKRRSW